MNAVAEVAKWSLGALGGHLTQRWVVGRVRKSPWKNCNLFKNNMSS